MVDPIGALGTAVGLASFAIQTCQGLLQYYDAWKGYNEDIEKAYNSIKTLGKNYTRLKDVLDGGQVPCSQRQPVDDCLLQSKDSLAKLNKKLEKLRQHQDTKGFQRAIKAECLRLLYPFKKDTLDKLRNLATELLHHLALALQVLHLDVDLQTQSAVTGVKDQLTSIEADIKNLLTAEERRKVDDVLAWLNAPDPSVSQNDNFSRHEPGTGQWFLQSDAYRVWCETRGSRLWVHGKAGCCKSVLCAIVIDDLQKRLKPSIEPAARLVYFYFSFSDTRKQLYLDLLRSLVTQLLTDERIPPTLEESNRRRIQLNIKTLEHILISLAQKWQRLYLVIDALDECPASGAPSSQQEVLSGLQRLTNQLPNLSVLATSRPESDIQDFMSEWSPRSLAIRADAVDADIALYVEREIEKNPKLRRLNQDLKMEILTTFRQKGDGMFRWAHCQMNELMQIKVWSPTAVRKKLASLPRTLDETYERMLLAITDEYEQAIAIRALTWLAFAERPLRLVEVEEACAINLDVEPYIDEQSRLELGSVLSLLSSLVSVSGFAELRFFPWHFQYHIWDMVGGHPCENSVLRLAHFSVKEYLLSSRIRQSHAAAFALTSKTGQVTLAQSCVRYLQSCSSESTHFRQRSGPRGNADSGITNSSVMIYPSTARNKRRLEELNQTLPLLSYAVQNLMQHQTAAELHGWRDSISVSLVHLNSALLYDWQVLHPYCYVSVQLGWEQSPLYTASTFGLPQSVQALALDADIDVNMTAGFHGAALHAACAVGGDGGFDVGTPSDDGCAEVVKILMARGATIDLCNDRGETPLFLAARSGRSSILQLLLSNGAYINARNHDGATPLLAALQKGHGESAQLLIDRGADIFAEDDTGSGTVDFALQNGFEDIAKYLLDRGVQKRKE